MNSQCTHWVNHPSPPVHGNVSWDHKNACMEERSRGPLPPIVGTPQTTENGPKPPVLRGGEEAQEGSAKSTPRKSHQAVRPTPSSRPPSAPPSSVAEGELPSDHISEYPSQSTHTSDSGPTRPALTFVGRTPSYADSDSDDVSMETGPDGPNPPRFLRPRSTPPPPTFHAKTPVQGTEFEQDIYTYMYWAILRITAVEEDMSDLMLTLTQAVASIQEATMAASSAFGPGGLKYEAMDALKDQHHTSCATVESTVSSLGARVTVLQSAIDDLRRQAPPPARPPRSFDRPTSPAPVSAPSIPAPAPSPAHFPPPLADGDQSQNSNPPAMSLSLAQVERELSQPGISAKRRKNVLKQRSRLLGLVTPEVQAWAEQQSPVPSNQVSTTPAPSAPSAPSPPHEEDTPWSVIAARNASKPLTLKSRRVANRDNSNLWIVWFTDSAPKEEECLTDCVMWSLVNSIDKSVYGFEALSVNWSGCGKGPSIMIRFSGTTIANNIDTHCGEIRKRLAHGKDVRTVTLTKNVRRSKVVVASVPCMDPINGDVPYTIAHVTEEMAKNPLFKRLKFISHPHWLTDNLELRTLGNIAFVFEDPDGSYADDLIF